MIDTTSIVALTAAECSGIDSRVNVITRGFTWSPLVIDIPHVECASSPLWKCHLMGLGEPRDVEPSVMFLTPHESRTKPDQPLLIESGVTGV